MWRPKDWDRNPLFVLKCKPQEAYEAGADAMLEAVRKNFRCEIGVDDDGRLYCNLLIAWAITEKSLEVDEVKVWED